MMTIATTKPTPAITLLASGIYTRWRLEANYTLSPLHSEWVIAWLALSLNALIEREARTLWEKFGATALQSRIDFLLTAAERLESQLAESREATKEARRERDVLRGQQHGQKHSETKKETLAERRRELKYLIDAQSKLTRKLSDAQAVIESLKEQNQRLREENATLVRRRFADEMPERVMETTEAAK